MKLSKPVSIEKQLESIPPLPLTVSRVMEVTKDPESSANDLIKVILPDQPMCLAVLKIANSVLYGRPKQVSSLETAVTVLGFDEVRNIVLAKAAVTAFKPMFKTHKRDMQVFWDHAFTCGLAARIISEHINQHSGLFFVAGLLHDVGKIALLLAYGEKYDTSLWFTGLTTVEKLEQEKQTFSLSHDIIGGRLLQRWQFPKTLVAALNSHHSPQGSPDLAIYPLIIQLADFLSDLYVRPETLEGQDLNIELEDHLPGFAQLWCSQNLPWEEVTLDTCFAWLKVDREHGSAILDILSS